MAEVFLAREPLAHGLAKILVIKKIRPALAESAQFRQMFEDEAKIAVNLNHPNIVQTFGYGQIDGTYFLAMEHVEGTDLLRVLNAAITAERRIPFGLAAYLGQQVAKALDYAHRKSDEAGEPLGIVHRDVSPQNILVSWDGMIKLVDFGIARARHVRENEGAIKGKLSYMSPEQAAGAPVDLRSDIFSLGVVLWELVCARPLFGHLKGREAHQAILEAAVPAPRSVEPEVPAELEAIIVRALARDPGARFQTARDLHRALGTFFFALSSASGELFESGAMAAFLAAVIPDAERGLVVEASPAPAPPLREPTALEAGGGGEVLPLAERKPVVVVEGELSGLPVLRRQMGEARAREALLDFLRISEHVAYKHGAHADRLDERGFTYLIGLPTGSEDDAARAVALGRALAEALDGISRDLRPPLKLALAVERGVAQLARLGGDGRATPPPGSEAGRGRRELHYRLLGATLAVARELAAAALPGEVLVGAAVERTARGEWRFEELEPIELPAADGERGQVRARVFRVLGARPRAERRGTPAPALIGRDAELAVLSELGAAARAEGRARHALLVGEAGVGKASIVAAWRRTLPHLGLRAVGRPSLHDHPYALVADLVRDLLGVAEEAEPRQLKRRVDALVARLLPEAEPDAEPEPAAQGTPPPSRPAPSGRAVADALGLVLGLKVAGADELAAPERRRRIWSALRRLLERLATSRLLVITVEDLHFADPQSFAWLSWLVAEPLAAPALVLATARLEERIAGLAAAPTVRTIEVGDLDATARAALVRSRLGSAADAAALGPQILARAGGNPFFIHELLDGLVERGILAAAADGRLRWVKRDEPIPVPATVEALVASRLDRLPDDERDTIRRAALLGRLFHADDLGALIGRDPGPALERLCARGLVEPAGEGAYAFRNLVTKDVAYDGLPADTRALLHSVAADRLVRSPAYRAGADDARLAAHLAAAGERAAAGRALLSAGLHTRDHAGNAEAFALLGRALGLLPGDAHDERAAVHRERAEILRDWGRRPAQLRELHALRKQAAALGGAAGRRHEAEAFARLGQLYLEVGRPAAAGREIARALAAARAAGDRLAESEALRLDAMLHRNIGESDAALARAEAALAAAGAVAVGGGLGARAALLARAQALGAIGGLLAQRGRPREAVSRLAEALVIHRRLGARRWEAATLDEMGAILTGLGEYQEALGHYKHSLRIAQELGERSSLGSKVSRIGQTYAHLGDAERARRHLDKALALHRALADGAGEAEARISRAQVTLAAGAAAEARRELERALRLATAARDRYQEIRALVYLAFCHLAEAAPGPALERAEAAARLGAEAHIANGEAYGLSAAALAHVAAGAPAAALERSRRALALLDSGRDLDSPEEILLAHARVATAAGAGDEARSALGRALAEVERKAGLIRDAAWRARYLAARPARDVLAAARAAGLGRDTS